MDPALAPATGIITFKVLVSNDQAGAIIGKSGAQITALQETKNVFVKLGGPEDLFPGSFYRAAVIRGEVACVRNALAEVVDILWKDYSLRRDVLTEGSKNPSLISTADSGGDDLTKSAASPTSDGHPVDISVQRADADPHGDSSSGGIHDFVVRLLVPDNSSGAVIGKGGKTVRALAEQTGAHVKLSSHELKYPGIQERAVLISGSHVSVRGAVVKVFDIMCSEARNLVYANPTVNYSRPAYPGMHTDHGHHTSAPHYATRAYPPAPTYAPSGWMEGRGEPGGYYSGSGSYGRGMVSSMPPSSTMPPPPPMPPSTYPFSGPASKSPGTPSRHLGAPPGYPDYPAPESMPRVAVRQARGPSHAGSYAHEDARFSRSHGRPAPDASGYYYPGPGAYPVATPVYGAYMPGYPERPLAADHGLSSGSMYADVYRPPMPPGGMYGYPHGDADPRQWGDAVEGGARMHYNHGLHLSNSSSHGGDRSSPMTGGPRSPLGGTPTQTFSTNPSRRPSLSRLIGPEASDWAIAQAVETEDRSSGASARPPSPTSRDTMLVKSHTSSTRSLGSRLEPVLERGDGPSGSELVASSPAPAIQPLQTIPVRKYPPLVRGASDSALIRSQDAVGSSLGAEAANPGDGTVRQPPGIAQLPHSHGARVREIMRAGPVGPQYGDVNDMVHRFGRMQT